MSGVRKGGSGKGVEEILQWLVNIQVVISIHVHILEMKICFINRSFNYYYNSPHPTTTGSAHIVLRKEG